MAEEENVCPCGITGYGNCQKFWACGTDECPARSKMTVTVWYRGRRRQTPVDEKRYGVQYGDGDPDYWE
jgi:hypothetical protein